jgi:hypothetical protein
MPGAASVLAGLCILLLSVAPARATEVGYGRQVGVGVMFGGPTGLSGKFWLGRTSAIDVGFGGYGYGFRGGCYRDMAGYEVCGRHWRGYGTLSLHADYLMQSKLVEHNVVQLDWHLGAGARMLFHRDPCAYDCVNAGVRGSVGLDLMFTRPSFLEVFLELAPTLYVAPGFFLALDSALGVRAYF